MDTVTHRRVQEALLDLDAAASEEARLPEALQSHLDGCEVCQSFAAAALDLDDGLAELATFEAPSALVERTERAVQALAARSQLSSAAVSRRAVEPGSAGLLPAIFAGLFGGLWALVSLLAVPFRGSSRRRWAVAIPALAAVGLVFVGGVGVVGMRADVAPEEAALAPPPVGGSAPASGLADLELVDVPEAPGVGSLGGSSRGAAGSSDRSSEDLAYFADRVDEGVVDGRFRTTVDGLDTGAGERAVSVRADLAQRLEGGYVEADQRGEPAAGRGGRNEMVTWSMTERLAPIDVELREIVDETLEGEDRARADNGRGDDGRDDRGPQRRTQAPPRDAARGDDLSPSADARTEGLTFRSPTGYWANTYVPGDPAIRALRRRLADDPVAARLAELASPAEPGFEAPRTGALSLSISADRARVEGRTRVLMSVGIRGAAQRAGRRPSLRTQVLLDLRRPLDEVERGRVRALLSALSRRHEGADQIGLLIAGPDGGARIELGAMRHGEVTVALRRAFGARPSEAAALGLRQGLERAVESISQLREDAPLGSSTVILVTPALSDADSRELESVAHVGALAGVNTTVLALGSGAPLAPLERLALAGQGRRRVLDEARDADRIVRDEIAAVSRVVARAVRLRIRLADGVQLVGVLGSRSLDERRAARVRQQEQAIDRSLAARLGIASDRGDDEDGIQIVVPAFYADDAHRVLLDLVVSGPGPVADVQVRFKDLLRLGNGTLTDRLVLNRGASTRGPAQRRVYAEGLAFDLASALRAAAAELDAGRPDGARATLDSARARLDAAIAAVPELASAPALARDVSLCRVYRDAIGVGDASTLSASLRFAAHRRLLGDPLGLSGEP